MLTICTTVTKCNCLIIIPSSVISRTLPLFKCHTFEVLREREGLSVVINLRFGAYLGHVLEFRVSAIILHRQFDMFHECQYFKG
jgi:hypothetical protein